MFYLCERYSDVNEIDNIKNTIYDNGNLLKENENMMNEKINNQMEDMAEIINTMRKKREIYEEAMFGQINDFIVEMKYALG